MGAVPECGVEHIDVFVNQGLFILFKEVAEFGDNFRNIWGEIVHGISCESKDEG